MVHESSCSIVANREASLYHACAALLACDDRACSLLEERVEIAHVVVAVSAVARIALVALRFRKFHRVYWSRLLGYVLVNLDNLRRVDECTLYTCRLVAVEVQHVAHTDKLVCTRTVENDS